MLLCLNVFQKTFIVDCSGGRRLLRDGSRQTQTALKRSGVVAWRLASARKRPPAAEINITHTIPLMIKKQIPHIKYLNKSNLQNNYENGLFFCSIPLGYSVIMTLGSIDYRTAPCRTVKMNEKNSLPRSRMDKDRGMKTQCNRYGILLLHFEGFF